MTGSREMTRGMSGELYICPAILIFHQTYSDLREDQTIDARGLRRAWRGKRKLILLGRGDRLDAAHLYRCVPVSLSHPPPPNCISSPFASASLCIRLPSPSPSTPRCRQVRACPPARVASDGRPCCGRERVRRHRRARSRPPRCRLPEDSSDTPDIAFDSLPSDGLVSRVRRGF